MENKIYDAEVKISKWNKVIKLNEDGDTITINVGDFTLGSRLLKLFQDIRTMSEEIYIKKDINADDPDEVLKNLEIMNEKQKNISNMIDDFFGENTCYKVFKTNIPYIDDVIDFMFQMCKIIEEFTGQKMQNLENIQNKYIGKQKTRRKI